MSSRILTNNITTIDDFIRDPHNILNNTEDGTIAIFSENIPAFYAITPLRLAQLLELEASLSKPSSDVMLNIQFFEEPITYVPISIGKFAMYNEWKPDADFQRQAALWGITLTEPVTSEELTAFISWWKEEKKIFTHIQWQQKLARSIQINRISRNSSYLKRNINIFSQTDTQIPHGFRGAK